MHSSLVTRVVELFDSPSCKDESPVRNIKSESEYIFMNLFFLNKNKYIFFKLKIDIYFLKINLIYI